MNKVVITKEMKNIDFYDGASHMKNAAPKNEYWLCSSNQEEYNRSYISFADKNNQEVKIKLFEQTSGLSYKYISEFQPPQSGVFKDDLISMANLFQFELKETANGITSGFYAGHPLSLIIRKGVNENYFFIYAVTGGRGLEGVYIFGLYEISLNEAFKSKYQLI